MDKQFILVIAGFIVGASLYWVFQMPKNTDMTVTPDQNQVADPQNSVFYIDGQAVTLKDGASSVPAAPDSASMIVTKYFGNEVRGDFNNDDKEDIAFIVTQTNGGSGTFYYLTALVSGETGYKGTEAVLLGDRISLQTTEYRNAEIIVNYMDRKTGDPMSAVPSVAASRYFTVKNNQFQEDVRTMSETDARIIAEASCIKGGEALGSGIYDAAAKTWSFDANLNATRLGCVSVCALNVETKIAAIGWRCTGTVPPADTDSGTACTMEAKICPDGSAVGRNGPNCEFTPCPTEALCEGGTCPADDNQKTTCPAGSRDADACIQIYDPVCATVQIQCIKARCNPIKQTFSNSCEACLNPLVDSYSKGECAK